MIWEEANAETSSMQTDPGGTDVGTAVVTGARGIGYEVGRGLARDGLRVIFGVRNLERGDEAAATIRAEFEGADVSCERVDLADLNSVAAFGQNIGARHDRIEILVNNAGVVMPLQRETTADGFELHMGTNHLGHFALTSALLPLLHAADSPRVVVVGSLAHRRAEIDFDDLQAERSYRRIRAYGQSKLATLLFMTELQRRSDESGWGLTSTGAHPGFARTEAISRPDDSRVKLLFGKAVSGLVPTAQSAARPIIFAATSNEVTPAGYYGPSGPGEISGRAGPAKLAKRAQDPALAARMWEVSEELTGVSFAT
jgi:NAD(P)-dependent dehydrogenase (short-subunit alcohol dehydrogenase family)